MKKVIVFLPICLLFFTSCDSGSSDSSISSGIGSTSVDSRLQVYFDEFLSEADKRGVALNGNRLSNLQIEFGDLDAGTLGTCTTGGLDNVIIISNDATEDQYRWVVIHELGHCILRIEHRNDILSIMNSSLRLNQLNRQDEEALFDEFFQEQFFESF